MRRTLFTFPARLLPEVWGSASERVARAAAHPSRQGDRGARHRQARRRLAQAAERHVLGPWPRTVPPRPPSCASRSRRSPVVWTWPPASPTAATSRSRPGCSGRWARGARSSGGATRATGAPARPRWTLTEEWLGAPATSTAPTRATASWSGAGCAASGRAPRPTWSGGSAPTKGAVRRALGELGPSRVALCDGGRLPAARRPRRRARAGALGGAVAGARPRPRWAGSSATSTSTEDRRYLFDTNGNGGTTAWWCGRIVGCWVQDPDGVVVVVPRGDVGSEALAALEARRSGSPVAGGGQGVDRLLLAADEVGAAALTPGLRRPPRR